MSTVKKLQREIKKLTLEVASRTGSVEIYEAKNKRDKDRCIKEMSAKYSQRHGWLFVIAPYKFTAFSEPDEQVQERVKKYMLSLGQEFGPHGNTL